MNVEISEKQYDGIYKCYKGNEIKMEARYGEC